MRLHRVFAHNELGRDLGIRVPATTSTRTSCSRAVSASSDADSPPGRDPRNARSSVSWMDGAKSDWPSATTRTAAMSWRSGASLRRKALAPARRASYTHAQVERRQDDDARRAFPAGDEAGCRDAVELRHAEVQHALEGVREGLERLAPPTQDRELFETFVADLRPTVAAFRAGHRAALAGRYALAMSKVQRGFALFAKASKNTKAYGFPKGVCQAGSS